MFHWILQKLLKRNIIDKKDLHENELQNEIEPEYDLNDPILHVGNSITVNEGVKDPDNGSDIGGWQGRIVELDDEKLVTIQWDSITLKNMPPQNIEKCEKEGLDWSEMVLEQDEVTKSRPRDSKKDVETAKEHLEKLFYWSGFGAQGKRIRNVIANADSDECVDIFKSWKSHFQKSLKFPFDGIVDDWENKKPFKNGDKIRVLSISESDVDEMHGVLAKVEKDGREYEFPFCCINAVGKKSPNRKELEGYSVWFSNRP